MTAVDLAAIRKRLQDRRKFIAENVFEAGEDVTAGALNEADVDNDTLIAEVERLQNELIVIRLLVTERQDRLEEKALALEQRLDAAEARSRS